MIQAEVDLAKGKLVDLSFGYIAPYPRASARWNVKKRERKKKPIEV